jgi:pimeloyl-ACP methyl ester carboxylesterase
MKLAPFISGVFGTTGLGLSILAGVYAANPLETVLTRGLFYGALCYAVGYGIGLIAQQIALEHARHISKVVAAADAAEEALRREEEAARAAEKAEKAAAMAAAAPAPPAPSASPAAR